MEHKIQVDKAETEIKNRSTGLIMERDKQDIEQEKQRQIDRAKHLFEYTVKNKEVRKTI